MLKGLKFKDHKVNKAKIWGFNIPEHSTESFDLTLHKIMGATGHTQWTLSKALGVSNTTVSNYLLGKRRMVSGEKEIREKMEMMRLIADELDIKPTFFLEYRIILLNEKLKLYPELVDMFLDIATEPKTAIKWYEEKQVKLPKSVIEKQKEAEQSY